MGFCVLTRLLKALCLDTCVWGAMFWAQESGASIQGFTFGYLCLGPFVWGFLFRLLCSWLCVWSFSFVFHVFWTLCLRLCFLLFMLCCYPVFEAQYFGLMFKALVWGFLFRAPRVLCFMFEFWFFVRGFMLGV